MGFWQRDQQPEYTLTSLPTCPNNQDQLTTRFEKHDANYLAVVKLAAAKMWMRFMSR